jgi:hypothetical protein
MKITEVRKILDESRKPGFENTDAIRDALTHLTSEVKEYRGNEDFSKYLELEDEYI